MIKKIITFLRLLFKNHWAYFFIILVGLVVALPLLQGNITFGQDIPFHIARDHSAINALKDGQIIPEVDPTILNGFGYSFNMFYGPLSTYIIGLAKVITHNWTAAINIFGIVSILLSGIFMYQLVFSISHKKSISIIASVIYMAAPYHLLDLYIRQDQGEFLAFVFIPILFRGLYNLVNKQKGSVFFIVIGASGIILSHNLSAVIVCIMSISYLILNIKRIFNKSSIKKLILSGLLIIALTGFYILPLVELRITGIYDIFSNTYTSQHMAATAYCVSDSSLDLFQYIFNVNTLSYGGSNVMPFALGLVTLVSILLLPFVYKTINKEQKRLITQLLILSGIAIVFTTKLINWYILPSSLDIIQFPWRLLIISTFCLSIVAAFSLYYFFASYLKDQKTNYLFVIIMSVLTIASSANLLSFAAYGQTASDTPDCSGASNMSECSLDEYSPAVLYASKNGFDPTSRLETTFINSIESRAKQPSYDKTKANISDYSETGTKSKFNIKDVTSDIKIELPYLYYPGYKSILTKNNGQTVTLNVSYSNEGLVEISIPKGSTGKIYTYYGLSNSLIIGLVTTFGVIVLFIADKKRVMEL